ncbi:MAG: M55 family metallopeptidase [Armatimonadota bacterium]|nr:MAG: M55 family metallopeptidase [Armatimonadota bacterium]
MRVFIATDLEGVGGVLLDEQVGGDSPEYQRARHLLTEEVNAAVEGALAGGASGILVDDGHATGSNFIFDELHSEARYVMGAARPDWLPGLGEGFEASCFIGCHAMAGTQGAVRDHTMSSVAWHGMWVNGKAMGEIGLWAAMAGHYGVPCVLVSGCEKACEEAEELVPGIETVVTKKGMSRYSAILEPAEKVRAMIRERATTALGKAKTVAPYRVATPVEIRVEYNNAGYADEVRIIPGRERIDARTVAYRGPNVVEAFRML